MADLNDEEDNCNEIYADCPENELEKSSCVNIDCREFDFKIIYLYFFRNIVCILKVLNSFLSDNDRLDDLVIMFSHLRNRNSIKNKIMSF